MIKASQNLTQTKRNADLTQQLSNEIKELVEKRETPKRIKRKTLENKIELNIISKLIKKKRKEKIETKKNQIIEKTLETTKSTRTLRKRLLLEKSWTTYLLDNENKKVTNRIGINKIATKYYRELYKSDYPKNYNTQRKR